MSADAENGPKLQPWERFAWLPEQQRRIYSDWGLYLIQKKHLKLAENCYDKCLELNPKDSKALYMRSQCKRKVALTESALEDALLAEKYDSYNPSISKAICDALYELNEFEKCKSEWHNNVGKYGEAIAKRFIDSLVVVDVNLANCLGDSLGLFILKNKQHFQKVFEAIKQKEYVNTKPLWKILREQGKCDVVSMLEEEEVLLSPMARARRERWFRIFNQLYFGRNWRDVVFMRDLIKNDDWILPQFINSKPLLKNLLSSNYSTVRKFVKMLHVRSPLYDKYKRKFVNLQLKKKNREEYLNWIQYRTRRNMIIVLRTMKWYREQGHIARMANYVEEIMGNYVVLKSNRIMPWKFEFMNEVYNMLALAKSDRLFVPANFGDRRDSKSLFILLNIPLETSDRQDTFVFGKRSPTDDDPTSSEKYQQYVDFLSRMEHRRRFSKYSIEKCYLWYQTAHTHLKNGKQDKCVLAATRAIEETRNCNSILWAFLSMMLIVKAHASLRKVEKCKDALADAYVLAKILRNARIIEFVELCDQINEAFMKLRRQTQSLESMRKRRTESITSQISGDVVVEESIDE